MGFAADLWPKTFGDNEGSDLKTG